MVDNRRGILIEEVHEILIHRHTHGHIGITHGRESSLTGCHHIEILRIGYIKGQGLLLRELSIADVQRLLVAVEDIVISPVNVIIRFAKNKMLRRIQHSQLVAGNGQSHLISRLAEDEGCQQSGLIGLSQAGLGHGAQHVQISPVAQMPRLSQDQAITNRIVVIAARQRFPGFCNAVAVKSRQPELLHVVETNLHGGAEHRKLTLRLVGHRLFTNRNNRFRLRLRRRRRHRLLNGQRVVLGDYLLLVLLNHHGRFLVFLGLRHSRLCTERCPGLPDELCILPIDLITEFREIPPRISAERFKILKVVRHQVIRLILNLCFFTRHGGRVAGALLGFLLFAVCLILHITRIYLGCFGYRFALSVKI